MNDNRNEHHKDKTYYQNRKSELKVRRIQVICGQKSLLLCIPIQFIDDLGIVKGDYVKCSINENRQLVVEKAFDDSHNQIFILHDTLQRNTKEYIADKANTIEEGHIWIQYECPQGHGEQCDIIFPLENSNDKKYCFCKCHNNASLDLQENVVNTFCLMKVQNQ